MAVPRVVAGDLGQDEIGLTPPAIRGQLGLVGDRIGVGDHGVDAQRGRVPIQRAQVLGGREALGLAGLWDEVQRDDDTCRPNR